MKIFKLEAENYKKLRAIEITPEGNTVIISGKNGQGKTSTMDAIWAALSGGEAGKKNKMSIRSGEESATIKLDLGDLVVTRKWTANDKTYLTVENKDGAAYKSPQSILDALVGRLTFDPLEFAGLKAKDQMATLLNVVELDIDPAEIDEERATTFAKRTEVNREVSRLEGVLSGIEVPNGTLAVETSATTLIEEIDAASKILQEIKRLDGLIDTALQNNEGYRRQLEKLKKDIENGEVIIGKMKGSKTSLIVPDISSLKQKLSEVEETNALARKAKERLEVASELSLERGHVKTLTERISDLDKNKADAIKAAKMPVEGLSFDEEGLLFNGVPFTQTSSAEQLKVSVAMAMAVNPKLRVIRITDGSLLDKDSMKIIEQMAIDNDYQVWVEVVDDTGKVGICIEDGEVVNE